MDLPREIIESIERRWAAKLKQEIHTWKKRKRPPGDETARRRNKNAHGEVYAYFKSITTRI